MTENSSKTTNGAATLERVKNIIHKGNITKVQIKSAGNTVLEIPFTLGIVGTILAPKLVLLGTIACLLAKCSIEIEPETTEEVVELPPDDILETVTK